MTSPPQQIEVRCPACHHVYETWWRPSINLALDHFDEKYLEEATIKTCPACGHKVSLTTLIVDENGVWHFGPDEGPSAQRE